jgi:hypothetical protein
MAAGGAPTNFQKEQVRPYFYLFTFCRLPCPSSDYIFDALHVICGNKYLLISLERNGMPN